MLFEVCHKTLENKVLPVNNNSDTPSCRIAVVVIFKLRHDYSADSWTCTGNLIGVEGTTEVAKMLLKNKTMKILDLQDNPIGEEGTTKLIDSLTHNTTVELVLPKKYKLPIVSSGVDSNRVVFN